VLIQKYKIRSKGSLAWATWPTFKFWDPLISLEWLKLQISNFACGLMVRDTKIKKEKLVKSFRGLGHVAYFSKFGTPNMSERLKIQTSNSACWLKVRDTKLKNEKLWKRGPRSCDLLFKFWDLPNISGMAETSNFAAGWPKGY